MSKRDIHRVKDVWETVRAPVNSPASNRWRGEKLALGLQDVTEAMDRLIDAEVINYFVPRLYPLIGRDVKWVERRIKHVLGGGGVSQETYARMVVVLARLPQMLCGRFFSWRNDFDAPRGFPQITKRPDPGTHFFKWWPSNPTKQSEYLKTPFDQGEFPKRYVLVPHVIDEGELILKSEEAA